MKRSTFLIPAFLLILLLGLGVAFAQQQGGWFCPYCSHGQSAMGWGAAACPWMGQSGAMGQGGHMHGAGPGMSGQMRGQGSMQQAGPVSEEQARTLVDNYLKSMNNPNLKMGKFTGAEGRDYYEAEIVTKEGSLVDKLQVNKDTGWFRSAYKQ